MATIDIVYTQIKRTSFSMNIPDRVISEGKDAIRKYLPLNERLDHELDYAETEELFSYYE